MFSKAEEDYLKAIYTLLEKNDSISTNLVARYLGMKASSVTDMLKKLSDKKLVNYIKYKGVTLSPKGKKIAVNIVRKHRLWETFLVHRLNFSWDKVHDIAEQLEHIDSPDLINKLDNYLENPKFDPHGDPIPDINGKIYKQNTIPLSELEIETKAKVMGVNSDDSKYLLYLSTLNIGIGTDIIIKEMVEFDKSLNIEFNSNVIHISYEAAKHLLVKKI